MNRTNHVLEKMEFGQLLERKNYHDYMLLQFLPESSNQYKKILNEWIQRRTQVSVNVCTGVGFDGCWDSRGKIRRIYWRSNKTSERIKWLCSWMKLFWTGWRISAYFFYMLYRCKNVKNWLPVMSERIEDPYWFPCMLQWKLCAVVNKFIINIILLGNTFHNYTLHRRSSVLFAIFKI